MIRQSEKIGVVHLGGTRCDRRSFPPSPPGNRATQGTIRNCTWLFTLKCSGPGRGILPAKNGNRVMPSIGAVCHFALALRIGIPAATVLTAPGIAWLVVSGFLESAAASLATSLAAGAVAQWHAGEWRPVHHHAYKIITLGYSIDGCSAWFLLVLARRCHSDCHLGLGYVEDHTGTDGPAFLGTT